MQNDSGQGRAMKKRWFLWLGLPTALAIVVVAVASFRVIDYLAEPLALPEDGASFEIRPGTPLATISQGLADAGYLQKPRWFRWYGQLTGQAEQVRAGEYHLEAGITPTELLIKLVSGEVKLYSLTIVEGWTFRELVAAMAEHPSIESTLAYEDWAAFLASLESDYDFPEGLFLPETYRFPRYTKDTELLRQAYELMQVALAEEWDKRAVGLPITTPYEALVLASIIEKETALADERPRIAGVFVRRLQRRMRLQTDPTVIYGVGTAFDGNLTRKHLRTDTPYNTYTRRGLPPTPIALPGRAAIHAALHPADGNEVFFVATGLGDGSHKFSETKDQHDAAVREYLARQRAARQEAQ